MQRLRRLSCTHRKRRCSVFFEQTIRRRGNMEVFHLANSIKPKRAEMETDLFAGGRRVKKMGVIECSDSDIATHDLDLLQCCRCQGRRKARQGLTGPFGYLPIANYQMLTFASGLIISLKTSASIHRAPGESYFSPS